MLGEHISRLQIRHQEDIRLARNRGLNALGRRRNRADGVVEGKRPIQHAAGDLPTLRHFTERRGIQGGLHLGRHGLNRRKDRDLGRRNPHCLRQLDGIANDIRLGFQIGRDIHRRIRDDQRARVKRRIQHEGVAHAPFGAQPRFLRQSRAQQFIRMQAALHQSRRPAFPHQGHRSLGRGMAMFCANQRSA